ncbi:MAG: phosphatidylinositol-specific phospholipase C1-like protein [Pseudomonadales bacterium]|nr:phosphatidylinositol-specific phospholipase C1-like protein [Pseudomonadales bacterium]
MMLFKRMLGVILLVGFSGCVGEVSLETLRFNEIQVIGSHNSYKQAIDAPLLDMISKSNPALAESLAYSHPALETQLDLGLRALELEVYHDPQGRLFASPMGLSMVEDVAEFDPLRVMNKPGFKVLHAQDIDFRSNCLSLTICLERLRAWSDQHAGHLPIVVSLKAKEQVIDQPGFVLPVQYDVAAWNALDAEILAVLEGKLILPSEIQGEAENINTVITGTGWPSLSTLQGRFLFVLDENPEKNLRYLAERKNAVLFTNMPEGSPNSAVRFINNPVEQFELIQALVKQGYLVRTLADADTREARSGDTQRLEAAWASGAQFISTDFYQVANKLGSGYVVNIQAMQIPLGDSADIKITDRLFRCNDVVAASRCKRLLAGSETPTAP